MNTNYSKEVIDDVDDHVRPHIEQAKRQVGCYGDRITQVIQDHPAVCLLGAIAMGYFVARVMRYRN